MNGNQNENGNENGNEILNENSGCDYYLWVWVRRKSHHKTF